MNPDLINTLEELLALVEQSKDSAWASMDKKMVVGKLGKQIDKMRKGKAGNLIELRVLFAPTGPIQEISIDNGWGERFVELAGEFDKLIDQ